MATVGRDGRDGRDGRGVDREADSDGSSAPREPIVGHCSLVEVVTRSTAGPAAIGQQTAVQQLQARMAHAASGGTGATSRFPHEEEIQRHFGRHSFPGGPGSTGTVQRQRKQAGDVPAASTGYAAEVDSHSVGEAFARGLGDAVLEQTIEHLSQRRHRADLAPVYRDVASENLEILAAEAARRGRQSPALDRDAARTLIRDATGGAAQLAGLLQQLAASRDGLRNHPVTERFLEHAIDRVTWIVDAVGAARSYLELSAGTGGQAGAALLAMATARAQAAHVGLVILRPWCAYLQVHDRVAMLPLLQLEHRYRTLDAEQRGIDAIFGQLAGFDPASITLASAGVSGRVAALATAFDALLSEVERAERLQRIATLVQVVAELLAFAGSLRIMFTLGGPPTAVALPMPTVAGVGGAAALGKVVVSAEWIAAIRHLIQIGAISAAGAAEMLRIRGFTSAMAQATDLPQPVKDLLGEGPTTDAMKVTNSAGAGVTRPPRHHVLPQEHRAFFEKRGFTGDLDIDNFTVEMETAHHQAQHGGGNWVEGRKWPGEWNQLVMVTLERREAQLGRPMTVAEILKRVELLMKDRRIPLRFVPYRGG